VKVPAYLPLDMRLTGITLETATGKVLAPKFDDPGYSMIQLAGYPKKVQVFMVVQVAEPAEKDGTEFLSNS